MGRLRRLVRILVVGRRHGVRCRIRDRLGLWTWLDRDADGAQEAETWPGAAPSEAEHPSGEAGEEVPDGWVQVLELDEVAPGEVVEVVAGTRALAIANVDGDLYALDNVCPHAGGPLGDGHLEGCTLTCPWHGWSFDVRDGSCFVSDSVHVETVPVKVVGGAVCVPT